MEAREGVGGGGGEGGAEILRSFSKLRVSSYSNSSFRVDIKVKRGIMERVSAPLHPSEN